MEKLTIDNVKLLNGSIEKINGKTYETYLFKGPKNSYYIVTKKHSLITPLTTNIIKLKKPLKDESLKAINRFLDKNNDYLHDTKNCEFTKGTLSFVTKDNETYKFKVFGGFKNIIKSGYFMM